MTTTFIILFVAFTLAVHSLLAWSAGKQMSQLGFNRLRWTLFILIGGIPALLVYRAEWRHALRRLAEDNASQTSEPKQNNLDNGASNI